MSVQALQPTTTARPAGLLARPGAVPALLLAPCLVWIFVFFLIRKPDGPVSGGIEIAMAFVMVAFGSWVVWRRLTKGADA